MDEDRVAGTIKDFQGKTENAFGNMTGDADAKATGRAREAAGKMQNLYGQAKDAARDAADTAASYAKDAYNSDAVRDGSQALAQKVKDNPIGSLVAAGAIGFALALLMNRPPRRRQPRWRNYY